MVVAAILLAAADTQIDGVPLALLHWGEGDTLIEYHITQLQAAGVDVIEVVLGHDAERIIPIVARNDVEPIVDPRWETGEASWLRVGAAAVPRDTAAAIIVRMDEPRTAEVYARLLVEHADGRARITCSSSGDPPGRPLVVDRQTLAAVRNTSDDGGLDAIVARSEGHIVLVHTGIAVARIKTAEHFEAAHRVLS